MNGEHLWRHDGQHPRGDRRAADAIWGLGGDDDLRGGGGDDWLFGGAGADALNGGDDGMYGDWAAYIYGTAVTVNLMTGAGEGGEAELMHPLILRASDHAEDLPIHALFQQHLAERLHQRTNPVLGPIG